MASWTSDELNAVGSAEEVDVASERRDGTLRNRLTIWVVRQGDSLYVRSIHGRDGAWYRGTQSRHAGRIWAGGVEKDVTFEVADPALNDSIDAAYRNKYRRYAASIVNTVVSSQARAATLKLTPRA